MSTPRAVGLYARISSDPSATRAGVERQCSDCRAEAKRLGWMVADEYIDNDVSAFSGKPRPEYERMLADIRGGLIDGVLVWHQDRLSRRPADLETFFDVIDRAGIGANVRTVTGNTDYQTGDGILTARLLSAVAANESAAKSRRIRRKKEELAAEGRPVTGGRRPFGFTRDQLALDATEASVVRQLADRFLAGESVRSLTEWLEEAGIATAAGGEWRTTTVRQILKSPRIAGLLEHRGAVIGPAVWPAIISEGEHRRIVGIFEDRRRRGVRTPRRYLLAGGLLACGLCGSSLYSSPRGSTRRYGCIPGPDHRGCGRIFVSADPIERLISEAVLFRLDSPQLAAALAQTGSSDRDVPSQAARDVDSALTRLRDLGDMFASGEISRREFIDIRRTVEARLAEAERRFNREASARALIGVAGAALDLSERWTTLPLSRQQGIVRAVVDRATVGPGVPGRGFRPDRVSITWRL